MSNNHLFEDNMTFFLADLRKFLIIYCVLVHNDI